MSAPALRTQPVDRRRLSMTDRSTYKPNQRLGAIARAKAFKSSWAAGQQRKPFATEQKPGTGGFTQGIARQQDRSRRRPRRGWFDSWIPDPCWLSSSNPFPWLTWSRCVDLDQDRDV